METEKSPAVSHSSDFYYTLLNHKDILRVKNLILIYTCYTEDRVFQVCFRDKEGVDYTATGETCDDAVENLIAAIDQLHISEGVEE